MVCCYTKDSSFLKESACYGKSYYLCFMIVEEQLSLPTSAECVNSLKNVIDAMYVLNGKWKLPILLCLVQSPKRFGELQSKIKGISPKVLSNELKDLEINFLINRKVYPTMPVTIIYEASDYSHSLKNILIELSLWGEQHRNKIKQSVS